MGKVRWQRVAAECFAGAIALGLVVWACRADLSWFERHTLPRYCAISPSTTTAIDVARVLAVMLAVVIAVVARPRLVRWAEGATRGGALGIAVAIVASLVVFELWMRGRPAADRTPLDRDDMPHAIADERLGWRFVPSQTMAVRVNGRSVEYAIDAHGNRAPLASFVIDPEKPTILVAGESIAFGQSVPWSESVAGMLAADLGVQVVTVGVPTYGADQAYLRMRDALAELRHPIAVVTTMIPQEIRRTNAPRRPHLVLAGGQLELRAAERPFGITRLWRDEPYHDDSALELVRAIVADGTRLTRERGAEPLYVLTNYGPPCVDGDRAWIVDAALGNVPHIAVTLADDEVIGAPDFHPNARGARRLVDAIEHALLLSSACNSATGDCGRRGY